MAWVKLGNQRLYIHQRETLLAGLLRQQIAVPYQCQAGYCGTCRLKFRGLSPLKRTTKPPLIEYIQPPLLMLADDELLACCCRIHGSIDLSANPLSAYSD